MFIGVRVFRRLIQSGENACEGRRDDVFYLKNLRISCLISVVYVLTFNLKNNAFNKRKENSGIKQKTCESQKKLGRSLFSKVPLFLQKSQQNKKKQK